MFQNGDKNSKAKIMFMVEIPAFSFFMIQVSRSQAKRQVHQILWKLFK